MSDNRFAKLRNNLPWLARYPLWRFGEFLRRPVFGAQKPQHVIIVVANHFEPGWNANNYSLDVDAQRRRLDDWHKKARKIGEAVRDVDNTKFRHTNFYPAEQYNEKLLDTLAAIEREGLGETEIHLHHGVEKPDTSDNLRRRLIEFRDVLAERHGVLSRFENDWTPRYAFVHGNLALANSANNKFCGVDNEMQILAETGCYLDLTLPSAPDESQVPVLNSIYEATGNFAESAPHRTGKPLCANGEINKLPVILTGALVFDWSRRMRGLPLPKLEDGALSAAQPADLKRFYRWKNANIAVAHRADWIFVKLYCHGFFDFDQDACIGERAKRFFAEIVEHGVKSGEYDVHFASARETFNLIAAAVDGKTGSPHAFRNYKLKKTADFKFETRHA